MSTHAGVFLDLIAREEVNELYLWPLDYGVELRADAVKAEGRPGLKRRLEILLAQPQARHLVWGLKVVGQPDDKQQRTLVGIGELVLVAPRERARLGLFMPDCSAKGRLLAQEALKLIMHQAITVYQISEITTNIYPFDTISRRLLADWAADPSTGQATNNSSRWSKHTFRKVAARERTTLNIPALVAAD